MEMLVLAVCAAMFVWMGLDHWDKLLSKRRAKRNDSGQESGSFKKS